jgi:hypothetical protein
MLRCGWYAHNVAIWHLQPVCFYLYSQFFLPFLFSGNGFSGNGFSGNGDGPRPALAASSAR